jgi:hypothetical protein
MDAAERSWMVLSADEVAAVTNRKRRSLQAKELKAMRIPFRVRSDGSLMVLRIHVEYETEKKSPAVAPPEVSL